MSIDYTKLNAVDYFKEYFSKNRKLFSSKEIDVIAKDFADKKNTNQNLSQIARKHYVNQVVIPEIEKLLVEKSVEMDLNEIIESLGIDISLKNSVNIHLSVYAEKSETDILIMLNEYKNYYVYSPECSAARREGRYTKKGRCYSEMCNTKLCPLYNSYNNSSNK